MAEQIQARVSVSLPYDGRRALRHLRRADPQLAELIAQVGLLKLTLRPSASPFATLLHAIVYQQLSGKAAATIHNRVLDLFPAGLTPERLLEAPVPRLRRAGLSRNKVRAVRDLAAKSLDGSVPNFETLAILDDAAIIERLTAVRGVGRWTAEMLLIFDLGRPDVLPLGDLGVRKGFQRVYRMRRLPATRTLERAGRRWAPYRSVASWYLWRALEI